MLVGDVSIYKTRYHQIIKEVFFAVTNIPYFYNILCYYYSTDRICSIVRVGIIMMEKILGYGSRSNQLNTHCSNQLHTHSQKSSTATPYGLLNCSVSCASSIPLCNEGAISCKLLKLLFYCIMDMSSNTIE